MTEILTSLAKRIKTLQATTRLAEKSGEPPDPKTLAREITSVLDDALALYALKPERGE